MKTFSAGKILISIVALVTLIGPYVADWNETHIFNSNWPPHAKFHNAQTIMLGTLLGLIVLWFVWLNKNYSKKTLQLTLVLASFYWIGQVGAYFFPEPLWWIRNFVNRGKRLRN